MHSFMRKALWLIVHANLFYGTILATPPDSISGQHLLGSSFGTPFNTTYDYVIVGGGAAGLTLANRLSASGQYSIGVIEAGSFYEISNSNISFIPRFTWTGSGNGLADANPLVDWMLMTEPEMGIGGRQIHYTRGRTLGGSTARNHMVYHRATKGSYKKWADDVGDSSYEWENWSPYFDKSTTFYQADMSKRFANSTPDEDPAGARSKDGPVPISYTNWPLAITTWFMKATEAVGMKRIPSFIDGDLIGTSWNLRAVEPDTMVRASSETAYLRPALKRGNLIVHHTTMATKIVFNGTTAVGVACDTLGQKFQISARKEVILSAGAVHSPQLLMVSGIGPAATLQKFNIPVLVDAPGVGQGIEDHPTISVMRKVTPPSSTVLNTAAKMQAAIESYNANATGPLVSTGGELVAWEKVPLNLVSNNTAAALAKTPADWPELEYLVSSTYPGTPPDNGDYAGLSVVLVNTFSRGNVTIASSSVFDHPLMTVNFLTDPRDKDIMIAGFRRAREILNNPVLSPVVVGPEAVPGTNVTTDEQIWAYIQGGARTISHVSCTCKMGKSGDEMAVVDSKGLVFGVEKLRIVDLSAVPFLPPGHPMSTVYALAEKTADLILKGE
ncbi:GMC oxidoreductase [Periconia macrospinosa]|uniref:GMC oxidoreductase n=1 Tax=Periconia macrospinosa TaxID=97972 RepID=A0A2V1DN89_9PLEO|nr:GMC oxidoreductase [Periconia macrospinosa]